MPGTAVENLPGGILDRLVATAPTDALTPVRVACAAGSYAEALRILDQLPDSEPVAAWRYFAWRGCWLTLPDGTDRPIAQLGAKFLESPRRPARKPPLDAADRIVGFLLPDLRGNRTTLSPEALMLAPEIIAETFALAIQDLDEARTLVADRMDLLGHVDLLAADTAARAGKPELAEQYLRSAQQLLAAAGDSHGLAAAALMTADHSIAPLTSPSSWNCVMAMVPSATRLILPDAVELAEFDGMSVDLVAANTLCEDADHRYRELNHDVGLAAVALRRAYLAIRSGRPREAMSLAQQAKTTYERAGRSIEADIAATHIAIAAIADDRLPADLSIAETLVEHGRVSTGPASAFGLGLLCGRMGRRWADKGRQPERARAALGLAGRIWAALGEPVARTQALLEEAEIAVSIGDAAAAQVLLQEALSADPDPLDIPADPTDPRRFRRAQIAISLYHLASRVADINAMDRAAHVLYETVEPLRAGMAGYSEAGKLIATALLGFMLLPGRGVTALVYRIRAAEDDGDLARAAEFLAEARAIVEVLPADERDYADALVKACAGDQTGASDAYERYLDNELAAATLSRRRELHVTGLAFHLNTENTTRARAHFDALAQTAEPWWKGLEPTWSLHALEGRLLEREGDLVNAIGSMDVALSEVEAFRATLRHDQSKRSFFAGAEVQNTYLDATRIALQLGEKARAFSYAERGRARALLDLMMVNAGLEEAGLPPDLVASWRAAGAEVAMARDALAEASRRAVAGAELAALRHRLDQAVAALDAVESELQASNPRFWSAVNPQADVRTLDEVVAALPASTVLIQYAIGRTDLLAWAVTRHGMVAARPVAGKHQIPALVRAVMLACTMGDEYAEPAAKLAETLLPPFDDVIEANESLLIVPSGATMRVPFSVLPWRATTLGEKVAISVLPSASVLAATRSPQRRFDRLPLIVGDPADMAATGRVGEPPIPLRSLPGTRLEAMGVARAFPDATVLIGEHATEDKIRPLLRAASMAHFATHGILDTQSPLGSAILLASGASLTAAEFIGDQLSADLVVLSACHTGEGDVARGDELLGFGRVLFAAGARAAVVSLWAVDDRSAALLMVEFQRRRAAGASNALALQGAGDYLRSLNHQQAQAAFESLLVTDSDVTPGPDGLARNIGEWSPKQTPYSHPYHWAPFVLIAVG